MFNGVQCLFLALDDARNMAVWTLVGNEENWRTALRQGAIWGIREKYRNLWEQLRPEDILLFYCKSPAAGIVGAGTLAKTFRQDRPFWPDEERAGKVIYPYRFEMNVQFVLPENEWIARAIKGSEVGLTRGYVAKGLNPVRNDALIARIDRSLVERFGASILAKTPDLGVSVPTHSGVQAMLVEIGSLQRFLSQREYPMERERLDVVWRRVEGSVPTYVFEVQVGGDVQHALGKLKHAHDLWNSNVVLALGPGDMAKAESLLSGTFHEVQSKVKLVELTKIQELYRLKKQWKAMEKTLGIF